MGVRFGLAFRSLGLMAFLYCAVGLNDWLDGWIGLNFRGLFKSNKQTPTRTYTDTQIVPQIRGTECAQ